MITVATRDAPLTVKNSADFLCAGDDSLGGDEFALQEAFDAAKLIGGDTIQLLGSIVYVTSTSEYNNYSRLKLPSNSIFDGSMAEWKIVNLPIIGDPYHYNLPIFGFENGCVNSGIQNIVMDGQRDYNPPAAQVYLITEDSTRLSNGVWVDNAILRNSNRLGIMPRGNNWTLTNIITENNKNGGIFPHGIHGLTINNWNSRDGYASLQIEGGIGWNSDVVIDKLDLAAERGVNIGPNQALDGLTLTNGLINAIVGGILLEPTVTRKVIESLAITAKNFCIAVPGEDGAEIKNNCNLKGMIGIRDLTNGTVSDSRIECSTNFLNCHNVTVERCHLVETFYNAHSCSDITFIDCTFDREPVDENSSNITYVNRIIRPSSNLLPIVLASVAVAGAGAVLLLNRRRQHV